MIFSEAVRITKLVKSVKIKLGYAEGADFYTAYDGSPCPLGHSEGKLNSYRG